MINANKENLVKYLLKRDTNIKEIDYAIPLQFSNDLKNLGVNKTFYISVYYKNGVFDCINLLDELVKFYTLIMLDFIRLDSDDNELIKFHNLDELELRYINLLIDS